MKNKKRILTGLLAAALVVPLFVGSAPIDGQRTDSCGCGGGREDTGCGVHTRYPLPSEQFFHSD